ncbi:Peptidase M10 [Theobroma cacao]|nr:Peptidase M10 [Theobroma cacao]
MAPNFQIRFQDIVQGAQADIRIDCFLNDHGDGIPFDGSKNTLAYAFAPKDERFHYDANENSSPNPTTPKQMT